MTYWIIVHKPSGGWIWRNNGRGQTWIEPTDKKPPRLFATEGDASRFLTIYAKGPLVADVDYQDGYFREEKVTIGWKPDPKNETPRNRDDYEVRRVRVETY